MEVFISGAIGTSSTPLPHRHTLASGSPAKDVCWEGNPNLMHLCVHGMPTLYMYIPARLPCQWIEGDPMLHPTPRAGDTSPCLLETREPHIPALQCWFASFCRLCPSRQSSRVRAVSIYLYIHKYIYLYVYIHIHIYMHAYVYIYTHITHMHIYT